MPITADLIDSAYRGERAALLAIDAQMRHRTAEERVRFALQELPGAHVLSSSFGAQAAVSLHLVTRLAPHLPVILVDTGYLFPETYQYVDALCARLELNLQVVRPAMSAAWLEARNGKLWEQGLEGLERYGEIAKAEPMRRALRSLGAGTWISGLRRSQSTSREKISFLEQVGGRFKVYPLADWSDRDVGRYLNQHDLPNHPLWERGYVSIGDWHTTRPLSEAGSVEATRFFGLKRECGVHDLAG
jgi:phosphoadenosine phosphosulfate reductase